MLVNFELKIAWSKLPEILSFFTKKNKINKSFLTILETELTPFWKMFLQVKQLFDA